jgi:hypothetical protein
MSRYLLILWISYAALMGVLVGASFDSAFFSPQKYSSGEQQNSAADQKSLEGRQEATNEALADYTKWLARYTGLLFAATVAMGIATIGLYASGQDQIKLSRGEFLSSHRPRMRLKHMWLTDDFAWRQGGPLEVNLDIVNIGNTEGLVTWINYISILLPPGQSLPQRPPYDEMPFGPDMRITRFRTFTPLGAGITLARPVCDGTILDPQEVHDVLWNDQRLFLVGTIEYFDQGGGLRQTGFCRRLTFNAYPPLTLGDLGRFEKEDDPDYEFEEWGN